MKFLAIAVCILLTVAGCKQRTEDPLRPKILSGGESFCVEIFNEKEQFDLGPLPFSGFIDSVRFIKLETHAECLIRTVSKIFFHKEEIIIVDNEKGEIYFFAGNGKYNRKISGKGRGPGEYTAITVCLFNAERETFTIYDIYQAKIVVLDISGKYIKEIRPFSEGAVIRDMVQLCNGNYLCYAYDQADKEGSRYAGLWETDSLGKFVKTHFTYEVKLPALFSTFFSNFFRLPDGAICLKDQIHSDVYRFDKEVERWITYINKESKLKSRQGMDLPAGKNMKCYTFQAKGSYLFAMWSNGNGTPFFAVSLLADPAKVSYAGMLDFQDMLLPALATNMPVDNNSPDVLVFSLNPFVFTGYIEKPEVYGNTRKALKKLVEGMDEESVSQMNPVLELLYVK